MARNRIAKYYTRHVPPVGWRRSEPEPEPKRAGLGWFIIGVAVGIVLQAVVR